MSAVTPQQLPLAWAAPHASSPGWTIPLLASTNFCMKILLCGGVVDLRSVREVLLFDPFALLRIFRQTACEHPEADTHAPPRRLDDCLVALGSGGLTRALAPVLTTWRQQAALNALAEHAVEAGRATEAWAAALHLCPETAFLVGLLHHLPAPGEWLAQSPGEVPAPLHTLQLFAECGLPDALLRALADLCAGDPTSPWTLLVAAAYEKPFTFRQELDAPALPQMAKV